MNRKLMELAEKYVAQRKRRMRLLKTVTALALVVAICTSYVLMMPGLTMAAETYWGWRSIPTRRTAMWMS